MLEKYKNMKVQSLVIKREVLSEKEYEILSDITGAFNAECSFAVKVSDIKECLEITNDLNTGEEVMDCAGRTWIPDYDSDINFMTKILKESEGCDYIIVEFDNYYEPYTTETD